jgi:hypothetical protein
MRRCLALAGISTFRGAQLREEVEREREGEGGREEGREGGRESESRREGGSTPTHCRHSTQRAISQTHSGPSLSTHTTGHPPHKQVVLSHTQPPHITGVENKEGKRAGKREIGCSVSTEVFYL